MMALQEQTKSFDQYIVQHDQISYGRDHVFTCYDKAQLTSKLQKDKILAIENIY